MPKAFEPDDLYLDRDITDLQCRPHGDLAACALSLPDGDADTNHSSIWLIHVDGGKAPQHLTFGPSDSTPRWCPTENALHFLSRRSGSRQVHVIRLDGGEARFISNLTSGAMSFGWAPNGEKLFALCTVPADPEKRGDTGKTATRPPAAPPTRRRASGGVETALQDRWCGRSTRKFTCTRSMPTRGTRAD
jgi:dipeptidyl aminopeptidase/acylaminoacyl peptidase